MMSTLRMYLLLFVVAIVAGAVLYVLNSPGNSISVRQISETLGSSLALFLAASIFPTIWVLLFRGKANSRDFPFAVGATVLVMFAYFTHRGQAIDRDLASTSLVFKPQGCTFSARFPGHPEVSDVVTEDGNSAKQANFYGDDAALRAECFPIGTAVRSTDALVEALTKYSIANGLADPEYRANISGGLMTASARAWKKVAERVVIYKIVMTTDGRSIITVSAGGEAAGFPQQGVSEFLSSVQPSAI